ncbi:glycosyltransferase family 39 protein [Xanthomonas campestris pv. raphani]|uniref:glycosyltransferase family 39 protein n=1 Tax=Xanthomonas campestris TaxID=339 RepID=UPI002B23666A|nr:glycosyltransferase family 39 protein [Xanthomonas campestris]MEA9747563.1 glycosyltransferase family 39 protein [Xanthomonas campestris pv. raphani]MEA9849715.1 glycosyltransferase family 39 protein [Xanthomonas campestris pv. raphani]MEA9929460.1 glycosyltransferase family 39 protein [Xanthomonas campestris pv. raphani]
MPGDQRAHRTFVILWTLATAVKLLIAARLPLFVDEAFYWQEGQHLAAAYSDLPGMTAWLTRLGVELGGHHLLALRLPFLAIAALLPWLVAHIATRWFGSTLGWQAGSLTLLMPLSATLGILAVPDVPMALAAVLCMDAGARLLREVDATSALELAIGLVIGALSHYRFVGVIGVGCIALLCIPQGRAVLRDPRIWMALTVGAMGWLPLLFWNTDHDEAGLRFQLVDRHPWTFQITGLWFLLIQAALVTPLLAWAMVKVSLAGTRAGSGGSRAQWRYFGLLGGISTLAIFVLGFFSDAERISFHWPLPGYLALLVAAPVILMRWPRPLRRATWLIALLGMLGAYSYYLAVSVPAIRAQAAGEKYYPRNFAGWKDLARAVKSELAQLPPGTRVLAENFKVGAELGFQLHDAQIEVLQADLNDKHGRSAQLAQWGLLSHGERSGPRLLVLSPSDQRYRDLLTRYHAICVMVGPLPPPKVVSTDHGYQRFLLFALPAQRQPGPCIAPAMAWIDTPLPGVAATATIQVRGWAFKDGVGLSRVELLVDGRPAGRADYGATLDVRPYWKISTDPQHPRVGFTATLDTRALTPGTHWLGLRLHGHDGSVEDWWEQPFTVPVP